MGLHDRDYTQSDYEDGYKKKRRRSPQKERSIVGMFIFINIALWLINGCFFSANNLLTEMMLLRMDYAGYPSSWYRFLTYGFAHSPHDWLHVFLNMLMLLMFGYGMMLGIGPNGFGLVRGENVESVLGRGEFSAFYLLTIVIAGAAFLLTNIGQAQASVLGASGGVCGVVILYAWLYPKKMLLFWGIIPMPMWMIGCLMVVLDALGGVGYLGDVRIAYTAHLAGAACGTLYYFIFLKNNIRLTGIFSASSQQKSGKKKPNTAKNTAKPNKNHLRVFDSGDSETDLSDDEFNRQLDAILKRYGEVGESGLTPAEREFLQRASRKFANKNRK